MRFHPARAAAMLRAFASAWSTGASARPARIEDARMTPPLALPFITSRAPVVSIVDCRNRRNRRPMPPSRLTVRDRKDWLTT